jgi:Tfp pilus assembly protein PilO
MMFGSVFNIIVGAIGIAALGYAMYWLGYADGIRFSTQKYEKLVTDYAKRLRDFK